MGSYREYTLDSCTGTHLRPLSHPSPCLLSPSQSRPRSSQRLPHTIPAGLRLHPRSHPQLYIISTILRAKFHFF